MSVGMWVKRVLDVVASSLLLILLSPVMAVVSLIVLIDVGRPILFVQERPGLHGVPFKLRSSGR